MLELEVVIDDEDDPYDDGVVRDETVRHSVDFTAGTRQILSYNNQMGEGHGRGTRMQNEDDDDDEYEEDEDEDEDGDKDDDDDDADDDDDDDEDEDEDDANADDEDKDKDEDEDGNEHTTIKWRVKVAEEFTRHGSPRRRVHNNQMSEG